MYYLIIHLLKTEYREDILLALTSCGIKTGSVVEGQNLDRVLENDMPLFSGLIKSEEERERYSTFIMAVISSKDKVTELVQLLKEAGIDIMKQEVLRIILLPVEMVVGCENMQGNRKK